MSTGRPRATQKVDVVILGIDACFFLRAVSNPEVHALMFAFDDRDLGLDFGLLRFRIECQR